MKPDDLGKILTLGLTLLGAYITFISFIPKILEEYKKLLDSYRDRRSRQPQISKDLIEQELKRKFRETQKNIICWTKYYSCFYKITGVSTAVILLNLVFSSIHCNFNIPVFNISCNLVQEIQEIIVAVFSISLVVCLLYLLWVAALFIDLFYKVIEDIENL
jgi:hypothetical protein